MTKILLVEDDKSLREIYGVRLLAEGYDIVSAGDGEEALAMAIKERPALIVSDVMMPKISGFDMLDILRSTTETKDIKVIMMTALSSEDQRQRGERLGADRYLVKSQVGIEDVVRTVHEVLGDLPGGSPAVSAQPQAATANPAAQAAQPSSPATPQPQTQSQPQQPTPSPQADSRPPLPQPTAPFSSSTPRPSNLGDRAIQPLKSPDPGEASDMRTLIDRELSGSTGTTTEPGSPYVARPDVASLSPPQTAPQATPSTPSGTPSQQLSTTPPQPMAPAHQQVSPQPMGTGSPVQSPQMPVQPPQPGSNIGN